MKRPDWEEARSSRLIYVTTFHCPYHGTYHDEDGEDCLHCIQEREDVTTEMGI